ncbi:MAG: aminopeptidase P N-terminal domain-containing protein [Myxococcota bacterium]
MSLPDREVFAARRAAILERMGPGVAVFPAAPVFVRNNDVEHSYRQDSDFYYLTGFDEPESVLVLTNRHAEHRMVLFVRPRDPEREVWDGARAGVEGAVADFGADAAFPIEELQTHLPDYLGDAGRVHCAIGRGHPFDGELFHALHAVRRRARQGVITPAEIVDPGASLHRMRLIKGAEELAAMRSAAAVTAEAHRAGMRVAAPGRHEYEVQAELERVFRQGGAERSAYDSIVGSGPNATVLHYRTNRRRMEAGDLCLVDAGCELHYYASDVTRTFPVSGRFTEPQRILYELVLAAQEASIAACVPGKSLDDVHAASVDVLARGLRELGLVEGSLEEVLEEEKYKAFYMHRTSHWLGMDVHDVGGYFADGAPIPMEPGVVLTVEPGLYIAPDAEVDARWRGIGIRIEDDVVVRAEGPPENLSADVPKTVAEVEAATQA